MKEKRCWICRRSREDLEKDLPEGFWNTEIDFFTEYSIMGKITDAVESENIEYLAEKEETGGYKPKDTRKMIYYILTSREVEESEHNGIPTSMAIAGIKGDITICAICQQLGYRMGQNILWRHKPGSGMVLEEDASYDWRLLHSPGQAIELITKLYKEKKREAQRILDFSDDKLKIFKTLQEMNHEFPLFLPRLADLAGLSLKKTEVLLEEILQENPELGIYDKKGQVMVFTNPGLVKDKLEKKIHELRASS